MNYSRITDYLYIGTTPKISDYPKLADKNIKLAINMRYDHIFFPRKPLAGIQTIWVPTVDSFLFPINAARLVPAVHQAINIINQGSSVLSYCRMGKHRSVLMGCAILIAMGYGIETACNLVTNNRSESDPYAKHIQKPIYEFSNIWHGKTIF